MLSRGITRAARVRFRCAHKMYLLNLALRLKHGVSTTEHTQYSKPLGLTDERTKTLECRKSKYSSSIP